MGLTVRRFEGLEEEEAAGKDVVLCSLGRTVDRFEKSNLLADLCCLVEGGGGVIFPSCFCTVGSSRFNNLHMDTEVGEWKSTYCM